MAINCMRETLQDKLIPVFKIKTETNLKPWQQAKAIALAEKMQKLQVRNFSPLYCKCENRFIPNSEWFLINPTENQLIILEACRICREANIKDYEMCHVVPLDEEEIEETIELMELMGA